jgi:hypothetical protein
MGTIRKAAGAWSWPLTPSSAEVIERVQLCLYPSSGLPWPVLGWTLPLRRTGTPDLWNPTLDKLQTLWQRGMWDRKMKNLRHTFLWDLRAFFLTLNGINTSSSREAMKVACTKTWPVWAEIINPLLRNRRHCVERSNIKVPFHSETLILWYTIRLKALWTTVYWDL